MAIGKKSLKDRVKEMSAQLEIMQGREHGVNEDLNGQIVTIRDYGFMKGNNGEYAVFIVDEEPKTFYFGGQVITNRLRELEDDNMHQEVLNEGLPVAFVLKKSKDKRDYMNVIFYPEATN